MWNIGSTFRLRSGYPSMEGGGGVSVVPSLEIRQQGGLSLEIRQNGWTSIESTARPEQNQGEHRNPYRG